MKSVIKSAFLCAVIFTSCLNKEEPIVDDSVNTRTPETYSLQLPSSIEQVKTAWVPGDKFVIHGEYAKDQLAVTLSAADISEDGKTCSITVSGVAPYEQTNTKTKYYISYPGYLVKNDTHCKDISKFNGTNDLLLSGYNKGKNFILESLVGGFAFTVNGDFDSYSFKGNNDEVLGYSYLACQVTENVKVYSKSKGSALTTIAGTVVGDGKTLNNIMFPGDLDFADGFLITLYKDGKAKKICYVEIPYILKRDEYISLGDLTSKLEDYIESSANSHTSAIPILEAVNLGAEETANCYLVEKPGIYSFKAVKGNTTEALSSIGSVEVLWETWGTAEEVVPNSVVAQVDYEQDVIYFRIAEGFHPGNAVIAAKNDFGAIMWSWHIWVPETPVTEDMFGLSRRMSLDRNIGALVIADVNGASTKSTGLFYQWGRKDPFVGVGDFATGEPASVAGEKMTLFGGPMSTAKSIKNPTAFANILDDHWNTSKTEDYWAQTKTKYDPCPPGYKMPYGSEYLLFSNSIMELPGWGYYPENNVITVGNPITTFPLGGYITTDGYYAQYGKCTRVWTSRPHSTATDAYNFRIYEDEGAVSYSNSGKPKSNAFAARCVRHEPIPFENAPGTPVKGKYKKYDVDIVELSGLCLHTDKSFLWGVGDQGRLSKITFDGKAEKVVGQALDMEAVTIDPETGDLYLGCEPNNVFKIAAPNYKIAESLFNVTEAADFGNSGIEGISWYKDGMLLVGTQWGAYLWAYTLDGTVVWRKSMNTVALGLKEIADICYDPVKDQIWTIDSETQSIYLFNGDATEHLATYKVNFGGNCESICLDYNNNCIWIADDSDASELFKIEFAF